MSPDKPFADQHPVDPQSWNLYSYVRNRPLSHIDVYGSQSMPIMGTMVPSQRDMQQLVGVGKAWVNGHLKELGSTLGAVDAIQSDVLSNGAVTKVVVFTRDGAVEIKPK